MRIVIPIVRLVALSLIALGAEAADPSPSAVLQIRLVLDGPSAESEQMSFAETKGTVRKEALNVQRAVLFDQTALKSAEVRTNFKGYPVIAITFTDDGRKRFAEVTRQNIGKRLAIIIDGQLYSALTIMAEISGGTAEVSGSFTEQEAKRLAGKITEKVKK